MNNQPNTVTEAITDMSNKPLGQVKVFMVEDDDMIRNLVVGKLSDSGCIPYTTNDGGEALSLAKEYQPDAIILDLMLPGQTGEEILQSLKADPELQHIPVIVFSNKAEAADKQRVLELGAAGYHLKAMTDLNELVAEIKGLTNK